MSSRKRRRWMAEQKLQIIEEARQSDTTVSEVRRRHGIGNGQFYKWQRLTREGASDGLRARPQSSGSGEIHRSGGSTERRLPYETPLYHKEE